MNRLIIDGYSLLFRDPSLQRVRARDISAARDRLIRRIERLAHILAPEIVIVFDGREGACERGVGGQLQIVFAPANKTADTVIEQMVNAAGDASGWCVVANDRLELETVSAAGAQVMSCGMFLEWLDRMEKTLTRRVEQKSRPRRITLGDFFPEGS